MPRLLRLAFLSVLPLCPGVAKEADAVADENGRLLMRDGDAAPREAAAVPGVVPGGDEWGLVPLGSPGGLDVGDVAFASSPVYRKAPVFAPGIRFSGGGAAGRVASAGPDFTALAEELAWHLSRMSGRDVPCLGQVPPECDGPLIVVGARIRDFRRGESVIASGTARMDVTGDGAGVSFAVTYLLESLGCRYLWPGASGKIIPRKAEVVLPDVNWSYVPALKQRTMRDYNAFAACSAKTAEALKSYWSIDAGRFYEVLGEKRFDRKGNRDFFRWHGVNDQSDLPGSWSSRHNFMDFWEKYGKSHPDWFALQPNGSRYQDLGSLKDRNALCLANEGLRDQIARDAVAAFRGNPAISVYSLGLPDGGYVSQCMCRKCRALDPVNAVPCKFVAPRPRHFEADYVSLSDRVLDFSNGIAERVIREVPGARFGYSVYSVYQAPSVKVRPHPALVFWIVQGSVLDEEGRRSARKGLAFWQKYGNTCLWRPNTFAHFRMNAPQNYARFIFEDLETFKLNHVVGTDFDCVNHQFATRGLMWYVVAKAHRNPDCIDYDDIVDDYCRAGFGAASADVRAYFDELERMADAATRLGKGLESYVEAFDPVPLGELLSKAERAAAGDRDSLGRIAFLRRGLAAGEIEKRLGLAWAARDKPGILRLQDELRAFMRQSAYEEPFAVNPLFASGFFSSYQMRYPRF